MLEIRQRRSLRHARAPKVRLNGKVQVGCDARRGGYWNKHVKSLEGKTEQRNG